MDKESIIRNFVIAASASVSVVGGTASVILDKYLPNKIEERKNKILEKQGRRREQTSHRSGSAVRGGPSAHKALEHT